MLNGHEGKRFWRKSSVVAVLFSFVCTLAVALDGDRLPKAWYLQLTAERAARIEKILDGGKFQGLRLPAGLYIQDHRAVWSRPELKPGLLIHEVRFDLPGIPKVSYLGFASAKNDEPQQLWIVLPNNQRFHLATWTPETKKWTTFRMVPMPESDNHWMPVRGGAIFFNSFWRPFFQANEVDKRYKDSSEGKALLLGKTVGEGAAVREQPTIVARNLSQGRGAEATRTPLLSYDPQSNRILLVTGAEKEDEESDYSLGFYDFKTEKGDVVASELAWPLAITNRGVYWQKKTSLQFFPMDWSKGALATKKPETVRELESDEKFESYGYQFFISKQNAQGAGRLLYTLGEDARLRRRANEEVRFQPIEAQHDEMMVEFQLDRTSGTRIDVLADLNSGATFPQYSIPQVAASLSQALSGSKRTWAVLIYQDGQSPEELYKDFVWKLATDSVPATRHLKELDRAYMLTGKSFDFANAEETGSRLQALHGVLEKRRAIAYLGDFPAALPSEAKGAAERFQLFWKEHKECLEDGTCRVVISMRNDVFDEMVRIYPDILKDANQVRVPQLRPEEIASIVEGARANLERRRGKRLRVEAQTFLKQFFASDALGSDKQSPGKELTALDALYDYLDTFHPRSTEIDKSLVQDWMTHREGRSSFRARLDPKKVCEDLQNRVVGREAALDSVCTALQAIKKGVRVNAKGPLAKFVFLGPTGTGKTFIPELLAEMLGGKDSLVMVDMSEFKSITKTSPIYQRIKGAHDDVKVVLFDDVDQLQNNQDALEKLAGIMDDGVYGKGSDNELDFTNTIVFWTANWGEKIMNEAQVVGPSLHDQVKAELTKPKGDAAPLIRQRIWGRIESSIFLFPRFTEPEALELALVLARENITKVKERAFKDVKIDPNLLMEIAAAEKKTEAGARSVKSRLETEVFKHSAFIKALADADSTRILLLQNSDPKSMTKFEVLSDKDKNFEGAWKDPKIPDLGKWTYRENRAFVAEYVEKHGATLQLSKEQVADYVKRHGKSDGGKK